MLITAFTQGCLDGFHMRRSEVAKTMKGHRRDREKAQHDFDRLAMTVRKSVQEMSRSAAQYVSAVDSRVHHMNENTKNLKNNMTSAKQGYDNAETELKNTEEDFEPGV